MGTSSKSSMHALLHPTLQQATTTHASAETPGHSPASLGQSLVGSLLLSPGSWCAQGSVCTLQESISQSCVSSGSSVVGLMTTLSKRAYAIPRSAAARAPGPVAVHCWPILPQETLKHSSVLSICGVSGSWCTQGLFEPSEHLWQEWGLILSMNPPSYHLAGASPLPLDVGYLLTASPAPTILLGFLWPWTWGISSQPPLLTLEKP